MIKKAVIPAAGYGTRFLPITKAIPKEMLPIIDRPTIEFIVEEAKQSGIEEILIIVSSNKNAIIDYFDRNLELETILLQKSKQDLFNVVHHIGDGVHLFFVRQKEQLGLGHAILQAETFTANEPFAVLLGDDMFVSEHMPALRQMIHVYEEKQASVLGTMEVAREHTNKYGICDPKAIEDGVMSLKGVVEKPDPKDAPSQFAIAGRYILTPTIYKYLKTQNKGKGGEIQLTDAILRLMDEEPVFAKNMNAKRYDVGSKIDYIEAIIDRALQDDALKKDIQALLKRKG
ncbi:MAG: UTP--glucose-1-phosphate uridylyltransferase GalU [Acholeplasmataceae bacterium]